ncbi:MAG: molybdenum cofactor guanylyltransferase [Actinobacteria bacterium]|nr:molybdenum cofactor guanylyltransferase [Actinomycetota bacterium]
MDITGIILAGGKSSRMGENKALLEIDGITIIERVAGVVASVCPEVIIAGGSNRLDIPGCRTVPDIYPGCGPLCGLHAGLTEAGNRYSFAVACDIPFPDAGLMKRIIGEIEEGCAAVMLKTGPFFEPLFSVYSKDFAKAAEECIKKGIFKVTAPLELVPWKEVAVSPKELAGLERALMNVNTPEEYERAKGIIK